MKKFIIGFIAFCYALQSAEFQNLGFEEAQIDNVIEYRPGIFRGEVNDLMPFWVYNEQVFVDAESEMMRSEYNFSWYLVGFNTIYDNQMSLWDGSVGKKFEDAPFVGNYSVVFEAFNTLTLIDNDTVPAWNCSGISQTAKISDSVKSIIFLADGDPISVFINEKLLTTVPLFIRKLNKNGRNEGHYFGVDVESFSGSDVTLHFTTYLPDWSYQIVKLALDDIEFRSETLDQLKMDVKIIRLLDGITLDWGGLGSGAEPRRLQVSAFVDGPWDTIINAENPYSIPESESGGWFYRVVREDPRR